MKLGLSLSGGGVRALIFHLGVLTRLAETEMWESLTHISTVSGGSLCIALVFENAGKKWPNKEKFLNECLPKTYNILTKYNLQRKYIRDIFLSPWRLAQGRAHIMGSLIQKHWNINSNVADIPLEPRWTINATCYETGKNWRFSAKRMGDYKTNYVLKPHFPLADAIAASAAVPGLIGPLKISTDQYTWICFRNNNKKSNVINTKPIAKTLTLWDGGVYDNLGVEALFKMPSKLRDDIDYLLVSDASKPLEIEERKWLAEYPLPGKPMRLVDIPMDQVRALRSRTLFVFFKECACGGYIRIGESVEDIFKNLKYPLNDNTLLNTCLSKDETKQASLFKTTLRKINNIEFELLFRHGYETCNAVLVGTKKATFSVYKSEKNCWKKINTKYVKTETMRPND